MGRHVALCVLCLCMSSTLGSSTSNDTQLDPPALLNQLNEYIGELVTSHLAEPLARLETRLEEIEHRLHMTPPPPPPRDCAELLARHPAGLASGVYTVQPAWQDGTVSAYCDMETDGGGWTVFQRRDDITPRQDFNLDWQQYRRGFGRLDGEFWWGNELLHQLTEDRDRHYELRVDLEDWDGQKRHAVYGRFRVAPESDGYRLKVGAYSGDAGDSLRHEDVDHNGMKFTTKDRDQDTISPTNCAEQWKGGWWFANCFRAHLNGQYLGQNNTLQWEGINWYHWKGDTYSLKRTEMKVREKVAD